MRARANAISRRRRGAPRRGVVGRSVSHEPPAPYSAVVQYAPRIHDVQRLGLKRQRLGLARRPRRAQSLEREMYSQGRPVRIPFPTRRLVPNVRHCGFRRRTRSRRRARVRRLAEQPPLLRFVAGRAFVGSTRPGAPVRAVALDGWLTARDLNPALSFGARRLRPWPLDSGSIDE